MCGMFNWEILFSVPFFCELCCELQTVHVYKRLRARVAEWGAVLLADDEGSVTHQVHAVSSVEDSIFMESSHGPLFLEAR